MSAAAVTRPVGRPPIGGRIDVRLSPLLLAKLDRLAAVEEVTRAEMLRRLVEVA